MNNQNQAKFNFILNKGISTVGIIIIIVLVIILASTILAYLWSPKEGGEEGTEETNKHKNLSPARNLEGVWKTPSSVTFYYTSDFCTGLLEDVAKTQRKIIWVIAEISSNKIEITWTESQRSSPEQIIDCNYYVPDISPKSLEGIISASQVTLYEGGKNVGGFSFTADNIAGEYNSVDHLLYSSGVRTDSKALKLQKQ